MKKLTQLGLLFAFLILGIQQIKAQTTVTVFQEQFSDVTTANTATEIKNRMTAAGYTTGGGSYSCSENNTITVTGTRFKTKTFDLTGTNVKLEVTYKATTSTTGKFQIDMDKEGTSGMGTLFVEATSASPTVFTTKTFTLSGGTATSFIHFRTESSATIVIKEIKITKEIAGTTYTLTTNVSPAGSGSVTTDPVGSEFVANTIVTLSATANRGYTFSSWSSNVVNDQITMDADKTVTANFTALPEYSVAVGSTGCTTGVSATVTGNADGKFYQGDEITLTATGSASCVFNQWSDGNTSNPRTMTVSSNININAEFVGDVVAPVLVSTNPTEGANIQILGTTQTQTVSFTFDENIQILNASLITINSTPASSPAINGKTLSFDADIAVGSYTVTISSGAIADLAGNNYGGTSLTFTVSACEGATLPYTAVFDDSYTVPCWVDGVSYNSNYTGSDATCTGNKVLRISNAGGIATFSLPRCGTFTVKVSSTGTRTFNLLVNGVQKATTGSITKNICTGLTFDVNSCTPVEIGIENVGNGGATISAVSITDYTCYTLTVNTPTGGTLTINPEATGNLYPSGSTVTLTATPSPGYSFTKWLLDGAASIVMNADKTVGAEFDITSGINQSPVSKTIIAETIYNLQGKQITLNAKGLVIKKVTYEDGSVDIIKDFIK